MGWDLKKPVFGFGISLIASLDMIIYNKQITKALIRLCKCLDWSVPLLLAGRYFRVRAHVNG